jgi:hypothetical protein
MDKMDNLLVNCRLPGRRNLLINIAFLRKWLVLGVLSVEALGIQSV